MNELLRYVDQLREVENIHGFHLDKIKEKYTEDAAKLAIFDEMRAALRIQVQNYWQTPDDNAKFRALLAKADAAAKEPAWN